MRKEIIFILGILLLLVCVFLLDYFSNGYIEDRALFYALFIAFPFGYAVYNVFKKRIELQDYGHKTIIKLIIASIALCYCVLSLFIFVLALLYIFFEKPDVFEISLSIIYVFFALVYGDSIVSYLQKEINDFQYD